MWARVVRGRRLRAQRRSPRGWGCGSAPDAIQGAGIGADLNERISSHLRHRSDVARPSSLPRALLGVGPILVLSGAILRLLTRGPRSEGVASSCNVCKRTSWHNFGFYTRATMSSVRTTASRRRPPGVELRPPRRRCTCSSSRVLATSSCSAVCRSLYVAAKRQCARSHRRGSAGDR
jgi:hypothetical protein